MAKDLYKYFRIEAQELLEQLQRGLIQVEKKGDSSVIQDMLRHAHTFKGAARVVQVPEVAHWAHALEDLLEIYRGRNETLAPETSVQAMALLDQIRDKVAQLDAKPVLDSPRTVSEETGFQNVRVGLSELDSLMENVSEVARAASALWRGLQSSDDSQGRQMSEAADRLRSETNELRNQTAGLRLVALDTLEDSLHRAVRDAALETGKKAVLEFDSGGVRADAHVVAGLRRALPHLVRNAVTHGIEEPAHRKKAGKPEQGTLRLRARRRGSRVHLQLIDDGTGFDLERVRELAVKGGRLKTDAAAAMDEAGLIDLLLQGGLSTSDRVSSVAGRGLGLDAVRQTLTELKGEISALNHAQGGAVFDLRVPISLAALPALLAEGEGTQALLPLDSVLGTFRMPAGSVSRTSEGDRVVVDGVSLPYLHLDRLLGGAKNSEETDGVRSVVVLESGGRRAALGTRHLGGLREVVVASLPPLSASDPVVAGAAVDDQGQALPMLSPAVLVRRAQGAAPSAAPTVRARPLPLLIIDDSLTTRMLEQSILESAGYEVDLAVHGEEGLEKAHRRAYGMFIVDVEMPGMNGFEFIEAAKADPQLSKVPAVLVTSRSDPADLRRGKEVGARAYIVKSQFDQRELLDAIRRLVG